MVTKELIQNGISSGAVRFIVDPNMETGTVCSIGDYWFYFGGQTAEDESPEEYLRNADMDEVVSSIFEALADMRRVTEFKDEYRYYDYYLHEQMK